MPSVARDEREKALKFFRGLNARYREVMGRNPPTTYLAVVEEARGIESEIQLTAIQQNRSGNVGSTSGDKKRAPQEEGERESLLSDPLSRSSSQTRTPNHLSHSSLDNQGDSPLHHRVLRDLSSCASSRTGIDLLQVWEASPFFRVYFLWSMSHPRQGGTHGCCLQEKPTFYYQVAEV